MTRKPNPPAAPLDDRISAAKRALGKTEDPALQQRTEDAAQWLRPGEASRRRVEVPIMLTGWERSTFAHEAAKRGVSLDYVLREKLGLSR